MREELSVCESPARLEVLLQRLIRQQCPSHFDFDAVLLEDLVVEVFQLHHSATDQFLGEQVNERE
jgi:hypothetical protein